MQLIKQHLVMAGYSIAVIACTVVYPGSAWAGGNIANGVSTVPGVPPATTPGMASGFQVYRDPQSGHIVPPPPNAKPLQLSNDELRMLSRSDKDLPPPRALPGGGFAVDLQGRYRSMTVITSGGDGQPVVNCVDSQQQAEAILNPGKATATGSAN